MSKVKLKDIADIQAGPFGTQLHKSDYVANGIFMINAKNIGTGIILEDSADYVPPAVIDKLPRYLIKEGDILFGRAGSIERHTYVPEKYDGTFQGTNCIRIRCHDKSISKYVSYYLWLNNVKDSIENNTGGSVQAYITSDFLKDISVVLPDKDTIRKVTSVLDKLDKKIKINDKINDNLIAMSRAIYLHSFYGKQVNAKISDIIQENKNSSIQVGDAKDTQGNYPFFTSGAAIYEYPKYLVEGKNIYLNTGGNADVKYYVGKSAYSTDTWCISAKNGFTDYLFLLLDTIKSEINLKFFQGTGLKHLQKPLMRERKIYLPSADELNAFNSQISQMLEQRSINTRENQKLADLRDWLLPMLMNGQATIID